MITRADIVSLFARQGHLAYEGEGITQLQHGWQCGQLACQADAAPALQLAAWLHDLGHLMTGLEGSPTVRGFDDRHEALGSGVLAHLFGADVAAPVALHVAAKRYLVSAQPNYADSLSPDSRRSLALQGGPMSVEERAHFKTRRYALDAMRLRLWDDRAKVAEWQPASDAVALDELARLMDRAAASR